MIEDIERLVATSTAKQMLDRFADLDEKARRACADPVRILYKQWYKSYFSASDKSPKPACKDLDALKVAMLAIATRTELKPYGYLVIPESIPIVDVMRRLAPSWLDGWVEDLIEASPYGARNLAPLWRAGLCRRPTGDVLILGYYAPHCGRDLTVDPEFLGEDVWRFFEVEGGGEFSLASHDKYIAQNKQWSGYLLDLAATGKLDRSRLLDVSLDALERDFGQFRAGWYSRFHTALAPSLEEQAARSERYLHLLSSAVPPTVALALKALTALDKAGKLPVDDLLTAIGPALLSRHKSTAMSGLQLLGSAARRAPERAGEIALTALAALVADTAEVQEKALDLVERVGEGQSPAVQAVLAEHREIVAPSVRRRLSLMLPQAAEVPIVEIVVPDAPVGIPSFAPVAPAASVEEALALYLAVLENPRDAIAVERAIDGLSRFGAASPAGSSPLSPLAKRAGQLLSKGGHQRIRLSLAACARAWCEAAKPSELFGEEAKIHRFNVIGADELAACFLERCDEVVARVRDGLALPLLSLPSDQSGQVLPADLADRLELYRLAGVVPGPVDLALALTRLGLDGRKQQLARVDHADETGKLVAFALGADGIAPGCGGLWASAWLARAGGNGPAEAAWPAKKAEPDGGVPAQYKLVVETEKDSPYWCKVSVVIAPELQRPDCQAPGSLLHLRKSHRWWHASPCGYEACDIAWAALVRPANPEAFLANALSPLDTSQKLANHPCIAYLDAFDRMTGEPGEIGYAVLAYYLASEDKGLSALTLDKVSRLVEIGRFRGGCFAAAILPFMRAGPFPSARWTRSLAALAALGPLHARFVRDVLAGLLRFEPGETPRDIGSMVELLYELHLDGNEPLEDEAAIACLKGLDAGGKTAKFSNKLLAIQRA